MGQVSEKTLGKREGATEGAPFDFKEDVFDKRLKTHHLKGNLKEYYAFSISYSDRIVFRLLDDEEILFIEIGSHDICY